MIRNTICLVMIFYCLGAISEVYCDVMPSNPKQLAESATTIVVGRITNLEIKEEPASSGFTDLAFYYTLEVSAVEKGGSSSAGDSIVVRAWHCKERNRPTVEARGHRPLPAVGEELRVFLRGQAVEFPNGFAPAGSLDAITNSQFFKLQSEIKTTDRHLELMVDVLIDGDDETPAVGSTVWWVGGIFGMAVVFCVAFFVIRARR